MQIDNQNITFNYDSLYDGKIIKGIAGFYYVYLEGLGIVSCKAKGEFRNRKVKPLVGDMVSLKLLDLESMTGNIEDILPRKNTLIRPASANIDQAVVVFAMAKPEPHLNLLDRFLVIMKKQDIPVVIVFNKTDLVDDEEVRKLRNIYEGCGYKTFSCVAREGLNSEGISEILSGKTSVLAGPSGVGKSTIMNLMQPEAKMETGEISRKIGRGKNTTRHTELVYIKKDTYLLDTPGFSSLFIDDVEAADLASYYVEFVQHEKNCKFGGCSHVKEKECGVKDALKQGLISKERYDNYCKLYTEAISRKKY